MDFPSEPENRLVAILLGKLQHPKKSCPSIQLISFLTISRSTSVFGSEAKGTLVTFSYPRALPCRNDRRLSRGTSSTEFTTFDDLPNFSALGLTPNQTTKGMAPHLATPMCCGKHIPEHPPVGPHSLTPDASEGDGSLKGLVKATSPRAQNPGENLYAVDNGPPGK